MSYAIKNNHVNIFDVLTMTKGVAVDFEVSIEVAILSSNFNLFIQFFYNATQHIVEKVLREGYLLQHMRQVKEK